MKRQTKVCLIGCGAIGNLHLEAYLANSNKVRVSVVETDAVKRKALNKTGVQTYGSIDDALAATHDLFDVCLPTHLHVPMLKRLLQATAASIICEKPLGLNVSDVSEIEDVVNSDSRLVCALVEHFHEPFRRIKQWTDTHHGPYKMEFRRQTKKPLNAPWFGKPELGGDIALDLGIHDIDLALWFSGSDCIEIQNHMINANESEQFKLLFSDGSTASISIGWDLPMDHEHGVVNMVEVSSSSGLAAYDSSSETLRFDKKNIRVAPRFPKAYYEEIDAALEFARTGQGQFPSLRTVLKGLQVFEEVKAERAAQ